MLYIILSHWFDYYSECACTKWE